MNLKKLQSAIEQYKSILLRKPFRDPSYKWESLQTFQENWDIEAEDFGAMYESSFQNATTKRIWKRENYEPKKMMLKFIVMQPDFVRYMFKDLFSEEKDIVGRVDRFVFHCDELLREYKELNPRSIENNHYHDDGYQMVSVYLSFRFPTNYAFYYFDQFSKLLTLLESRDVPKSSDISRFFKVMRVIYKFLSKDEELINRHKRRLLSTKVYQEETLLLSEDFYLWMTGF